MSSSNSGFGEADISRIRGAYKTWADLTDSHLLSYDPERDDMPEYIRKLYGEGTRAPKQETVRYSLLDQPATGTSPGPYASILERAAVIAFQKMEPRAESAQFPTMRKVEFLDPFRALGAVGLMMVVLSDEDFVNPDSPGLSVVDYENVGLSAGHMPGRPFDYEDLTDNILSLANNIKELSENGKLVHISINDVQAMYSLQVDLGSH